jgi:hypothetical protein
VQRVCEINRSFKITVRELNLRPLTLPRFIGLANLAIATDGKDPQSTVLTIVIPIRIPAFSISGAHRAQSGSKTLILDALLVCVSQTLDAS